MTDIFKSIGIVFSVLLVIAITIITMYASYILGIGILLIAGVYLTYKILDFKKSDKYSL